jgi:hypothetical protein
LLQHPERNIDRLGREEREEEEGKERERVRETGGIGREDEDRGRDMVRRE